MIRKEIIMKKQWKRILTAVLLLVLIAAMSTTVQAANITKQNAQTIALKDAKLAKTAGSGLKVEKDGREYEVEFKSKKTGDKYEYDIDARTGRIREAEVEYTHKRNTSKKKISKASAVSAVVKASGLKKSVVSAGRCRYKKDGREWIWKIEFRNGRYAYEYEVLAPTGRIIEYSREYR